MNIQSVQIILLSNEKVEDEKLLQKAKKIFTSLKTDADSVLLF